MKTRFIIVLFALQTLFLGNAFAQVGINSTNADPDNSAMLDISSTDKGILIPRMTTSEREAINNPAEGLLVFDNTTNTFWYYVITWQEIRSVDNQNLTLTQDSILIDNGNGIDISSLRGINENGLQYNQTTYEAGVDVDQPSSTSNFGQTSSVWQSFTPTKTGTLTQIDLRLHTSSIQFREGDLRIFEGQGTGGTMLYQGGVDDLVEEW
ncbi:MAG: hypothetical protein AAF740_15000, partial [Bacteroidota bacterium]